MGRSRAAEEVFASVRLSLYLQDLWAVGRPISAGCWCKTSLSFVDLDDLILPGQGKVSLIFSPPGKTPSAAWNGGISEQLQTRGHGLGHRGGTLFAGRHGGGCTRRTALVVYLEASLETALARITTGGGRPLLGQAGGCINCADPFVRKQRISPCLPEVKIGSCRGDYDCLRMEVVKEDFHGIKLG